MGAGLTLALAQARSAAKSRDAAQARFEELRQLAHAVLFDYHALVEPLAGATPVRQRLVNDAIHYLDRLAHAAPRDRRVLLEMGAAYHTVGLVQRNGFRRPHLGDTTGAMRSYERSIALLGELVDDDPADGAAAYELALALSARGGVYGEDGQLEPARRDLMRAGELFTRHLGRDTPDLRHRLELARTHLRLADVQRFGRRFDAASICVNDARGVLDSLAALQPAHKELPHVWVWVHNLESFLAREQEDWPGVIRAEERVQGLMRELQAREPDNARFIEDLGRSAQWLMATHGRLRDVAQVARWADPAITLTRRVARADPDDLIARTWYLRTLTTSGWAFVEAGAAQRGVEQLDAARQEFEALLRRFESDFDSRRQHAAFEVTCVLARAAATPASRADATQAHAALDALERDFNAGEHAAELTETLAKLRDALAWAAEASDAGTEAWLARARAPLYALGVR
jgi:tetratricopeptide (TPR) repeat protein